MIVVVMRGEKSAYVANFYPTTSTCSVALQELLYLPIGMPV